MQIVIYCGGMPFNGDTIKTKSLGGSETAAYYVAKNLAKLGHHVTMFTSSTENGTFDGVLYNFHGKPTQKCPLGEYFHQYATTVPHDVCIIQRHPGAFVTRWASKLNILWLHDLALYRSKDMMNGQMWNVDKVWCVSEFHKKQLVDVYNFNPRVVDNITNGVDLDLYKEPKKKVRKGVSVERTSLVPEDLKVHLVYSSRPERGLENLVKPDGIMDRLLKEGNRFHLHVCGYDNTTPQMAAFYNMLWDRCEQLPNVTNHGPLTKQELAYLQMDVDAFAYPTEFEEVSCITAMEAMAAGTPFISSKFAVLPETCKDSGSRLFPLKDGKADIDAFVEYFLNDAIDSCATPESDHLCDMQSKASHQYSWPSAVSRMNDKITEYFDKLTENPSSVIKELMHNSDIEAASEMLYSDIDAPIKDAIMATSQKEYAKCYGFHRTREYTKHYEGYYQYEKDKGVVYGPEDMRGESRFDVVSNFVSLVVAGGSVLDYGCAHGHYTINLAKRFPQTNFVGVDIAASNIETARKWAEDEGITNVLFYHGQYETDSGTVEFRNGDGEKKTSLDKSINEFDAVIAAEVLEHVPNPIELADGLSTYLKDTGTMVLTTPYGPWEAIGYEKEWPWRAHVHHFERTDLRDIWGMHESYNVLVVPAGADRRGVAVGSYVTTYKKPKAPSGCFNYARKIETQAPRQTVSACLIVKDGESCIKRCMDSFIDHVDEIIVGIDSATTDDTRAVLKKLFAERNLWPTHKIIDIAPAVETGFDVARNKTIAEACGDWILWIDADEKLVHPENIYKYLRANQFDSYAIAQHHFAAEPLGILKSDMPSRLFRNNLGVKFFGMVHEHPELEMNKGLGHTLVIHDMSIMHDGYATEEIRRKRFQRNIPLIVRDREKNPDRELGKFLWMRDLAQMCTYETEVNGGQVTAAMVERANIGMEMWGEMLKCGKTQMIVEALPYYSLLVKILGTGFDFSIKLGASKLNGGVDLNREREIAGHFLNEEHLKTLLLKLTDDRTLNYGNRYF